MSHNFKKMQFEIHSASCKCQLCNSDVLKRIFGTIHQVHLTILQYLHPLELLYALKSNNLRLHTGLTHNREWIKTITDYETTTVYEKICHSIRYGILNVYNQEVVNLTAMTGSLVQYKIHDSIRFAIKNRYDLSPIVRMVEMKIVYYQDVIEIAVSVNNSRALDYFLNLKVFKLCKLCSNLCRTIFKQCNCLCHSNIIQAGPWYYKLPPGTRTYFAGNMYDPVIDSVNNGSITIFKLLIDHGYTVRPECAYLAAELGHTNILSEIIIYDNGKSDIDREKLKQTVIKSDNVEIFALLVSEKFFTLGYKLFKMLVQRGVGPNILDYLVQNKCPYRLNILWVAFTNAHHVAITKLYKLENVKKLVSKECRRLYDSNLERYQQVYDITLQLNLLND